MADEVKNGLSAEEPRRPATWDRSTVADGSWMQRYTLDRFSARDVYLAEQIDSMSATVSAEFETLEAAADVVDVIGTLNDLDSYDKRITKNDVIKVLNADGEWIDPVTSETYEFNGDQVYFRYTGPTTSSPDSNKWTYVGELDPYYNKSEIDALIINVSGTISSNYYKKGSITTGKNIDIVAGASPDNPPTLIISTKDNVSFTEISATGFSGTYISAGDGSTTATIENLITSAEGGSAANAWINNNTTGNSAKYSLSAEKVKWEKGTDNKYRPIGFANADQEAQWTAGNDFYDEIVYDSAFNYNPATDTLSSINYTCTNITGTTAKFTGFSGTNISASDGSTTATIENLIDSAQSGKKAFDIVNSAKFSANNTEVGYLSAGLILSSKSPNYLAVTNESNNIIGLSSNSLSGLNVIAENDSKTLSSDYNVIKFIGFDLTANPAGIELGLDTSLFVLRNDVNLYIGSTGTLQSESNSTALGFYTTAKDASFALGTMNNSTYKTSATTGSIALGYNNTANNYSITIGSNNSANNNSYIIGNNNQITGTGPGYILGVGNTADNGLCVLGAYAKSSHEQGDLLALGFGDPNRRRDALLVNQGYVKLFGNLIYDEDEGEWVEPNIIITPNSISSTFSKKAYHFSEIQGYNLEDTDNPLKSFNDVASNNMLIMGKSPRDNSYDSRYFAVYLNPETDELKNLSHSFKNISIAQNGTNQGYYGIRYGIANEYAVILKGFNPSNCKRAGTNPDPTDWTNCEYKYGNTTSTTWVGNAGTKLQTSFFYKEKNYIPAGESTAPSMFYLKIDRIALDQVVETIIDSKQKLFIMIKGDGN